MTGGLLELFIRLVIYLAIVIIILAGGQLISTNSMKASISDKTLATQTAQLDSALIKYYATHEELPEKLSDEFLELMGLYGITPSYFSYTPKTRSYTLKVKFSTGEKASAYSNQELPEIIDEAHKESNGDT